MAGSITKIPDDVLLGIFLELDSAQDLSRTIRSAKRFLDLYYDHKRLLLREVTFRGLNHRKALDQAKDMASCLPRTPEGTEEKITTYEVLRPNMDILSPSPKNRHGSYEWALQLYQLYRHLDLKHEKAFPLLNNMYQRNFLRKPKTFNPPGPFPLGSHPAPGPTHFALLEELVSYHAKTNQDPHTALTVRKEVWTRLDPAVQYNYYSWTESLLDETAALHGADAAVELARSGYTGYQQRRFRGRLQDEWAHFLLLRYRRAGRPEEALQLQRAHLNTLSVGNKAYVKWGRYLIVTLKRSGKTDEALRLKHEMWQHIPPNSKFYFGWTRELAAEYRMQNRMADAKDVIEGLLRNCEETLSASPRDNKVQYHAEQAAKAMAIEDPGFALDEYRRTMITV